MARNSLHHNNNHNNQSSNQDWLLLLNDLHGVSSSADAEKLLNGKIAGDSGQLHLLQEALMSLNHYFGLKASTSLEKLDHDYAFDLYSMSGNNSSSRTDKKSDQSLSLSLIDVPSRLKEYKEFAMSEKVDVVNNGMASTSDMSQLETVLAEDLFHTQQVLARKQSRLQILEMIQSQVMASGDDAEQELMEAIEDEEHRDDDNCTVSNVDADSAEPSSAAPSYDNILSELSSLGVALSERSSTSYPLGLFLEHPVAVVDVPIINDDNVSTAVDSLSLHCMLQSIESMTKEVHDELNKRMDAVLLKEGIVLDLQQKDAQLNEFRTRMEQVEYDRNEFMAVSLELQVLREKNQKVTKDDVNKKVLENQNQELSKTVQKLEESIRLLQDDKKTPRPSGGGSGSSNNEDIQRVQQQLQGMQVKFDVLRQENEHNVKENQRLKTAMKVSEQRVKSALQDQMTLHHQLQEMEEDLGSSKATITKLHRELDEQKSLRSFKEDAERKLFELNKEVSKRDVEMTEMRETSSLANKYHSELITSERAIETLEQRLAEYSVELEKGAVALNQLESYREQLRVKTKENRDLSLQIHLLESQLKDVPYLSNRFQEISEELQDCKIKVEKIPGLLAEIARLRGSSRASNKALAEQDKLLNHLKTRVKQLEKENALLKTDNRGMQDVETKLKEANQEIKRLMNLASEASALKVGAKNAEDEKKLMEGQYKKMRKFMRQNAVNDSSMTAEDHS
jgi:chromosome segregation ATPase